MLLRKKMELKDMKINFKLLSGSYIRDSPRTWIGNPVNPQNLDRSFGANLTWINTFVSLNDFPHDNLNKKS